MDVANLSLSSSSSQWFAPLHDAADHAYFRRLLLVCAANNLPGPTYPSQYASVISVAAHRRANPYEIACNPSPPVEFGALGIDVDVAWGDGTSMVATGNSFAAAHVTGLAALIASKHRGITPAQMKSVLQSVAVNAR
jgi:subtilisin family serine protease